jgi:hypothetical protein
VAKAKSAYAVARGKCDDQAGNAKDVCVKEVKAVEVKALAVANTGRENRRGQEGSRGRQARRRLQVAAEKCDAMAGDAKASCIATAKADFGKNCGPSDSSARPALA